VTGIEYLLVVLAAMAAGAVNALAGGGTLITFPMLMAVGLPAVAANVTNTVALCPGYFGATLAQSNDLKDQTKRLKLVIPAGIVGGIIGGILLLGTGEKLFQDLVPFLIFLASTLLAVQDPVKKWLNRRSSQAEHKSLPAIWVILPVAVSAIYGGYFGAGLSVIVLAVLGLVLDDNITRLNALKQSVAFATNVAAAIFFVFSGEVNWLVAAVMAVGALIGGSIGGRLAGKIKPAMLRSIVVIIGYTVAIIYLFK
jgi:hypothetical protein